MTNALYRYQRHGLFSTSAVRLGAEFWTADRRLLQAVGSVLPWVHLAET